MRPHPGIGGRGRAAGRAFTLLELLVAMFVFAMVLTSLYMTWRVLMRSNVAALELAAEAQRKRLAVQTIEEALNAAVLFAASPTNYAFIADTTGAAAALSFVAHLGTGFPGSGRFDGESVRRLWFQVEPGPGGDGWLVMRQASMLAALDDPTQAFPVPLSRNVSEFRLEFWDERQGEFAEEWTLTNRLPALVRMTLGFADPRATRREVEHVTRVVRIPSVGVAADAQLGAGPGGPR